MRNLTNRLLAALLAASTVCFSADLNAQVRRGSSSSSSSTRSSSNSNSASSANRSSASASRSTVGSSSASRSGSGVSRSSSTASRPSTSSSVSRQSSGSSVGRQTTPNTPSYGRQTNPGSSNQVRRSTTTSGSLAATRSVAGSSPSRAVTGSIPSRTTTTEPRSNAVSGNVSRQGLGSTRELGRSVNSGPRGDASNRFVDNSSHNNHYYDDHRMDGHNVMRVHPRERDFIVHDHIGSFWGHDPHYFGYRVHVLPPRYTRVRYYGIDYFRYGNVYYRAHGGWYVVCRPPFGVVIDEILHDIAWHHVRFAYYPSVYRTYAGFDSYSRYIDEQNRQIARNNALIAQQNSQIAMNLNSADRSYDIANALGLAQSYAYADQEYFYSDGVFYIENNGKYQTIVPPAGALVEELPDDYDTITLGGAEYYRVDDTVYRTTLIDGHPYLEVLGQMYGNLARQNSLF